jgi:hypothetical protein
MNHDRFKKSLDDARPDRTPMTAAEVAEAHRNLTGFIGLLFSINERVGLVSIGGKNAADQ